MKKYFFAFAIMMGFSIFAYAVPNDPNEIWQDIEKKAQGQTVYFHAWGGKQEINRYLQWVSKELQREYGVTLKQVKIADVSESTSRLFAEKTAGKNSEGSIDLVWVNGENFKFMKDNELLFGPFVEQLPNWQYVDQSLPVTLDLSEPTDGYEAPWGVGQLVFVHDQQTVKNPPRSFSELLNYSNEFPNRVTYPKPPEFHGTAFLKAALIELTNNDSRLRQPVNQANFAEITKPLWDYLDKLHKSAWYQGKRFPLSMPQSLQLLDDQQIDIVVTFNPNEAISAQKNGVLSETTQVYAMEAGALTNVHFLAIPWNSSAKEGALVAINFLLSPEAQSKKGDLNIWGDPSVLKNEYLTGVAKKTTLYPIQQDLHSSWQQALEKEWHVRYGLGL